MSEKWTNQRWAGNGPIRDELEMVQSETSWKWSNQRWVVKWTNHRSAMYFKLVTGIYSTKI